ncbi:MAG: ribbon-helix-helix domain-containing protein [Cyanobacteria bacterium]|nr:ribbon-helix-helix domain-containing protein [Cyanobacteriota bacterium]
MLRTTVYLNEGEVLAIRRLSIIRRCPQAEIIREAIRRYIDNTKDELKQSLPQA